MQEVDLGKLDLRSSLDANHRWLGSVSYVVGNGEPHERFLIENVGESWTR